MECIWLHLKPITLLICPCSRLWHAICTHKQHLYFRINYLPFTLYAHIYLLQRSTMLGTTYTRNSMISYWVILTHEWQPWRVTSFQSSCCQAKTGNMWNPNYWYDAQTYQEMLRYVQVSSVYLYKYGEQNRKFELALLCFPWFLQRNLSLERNVVASDLWLVIHTRFWQSGKARLIQNVMLWLVKN